MAPYRVLQIDIDDVSQGTMDGWRLDGLVPELDELFEEGLEYRASWAAPRCAVMRCAALTGCDAHRPGNLCGKNPVWADTWQGPSGLWLSEGMQGSRMQIGKAHQGGGVNYPYYLERGFDEAWTIHAQLNTQTGTPQVNTNYYQWWETHLVAGSPATIASQHTFATNVQIQRAMDAVAAGTDYIRLNCNAVHLPLSPPPPNDEPPGKVYVGGANEQERAKEYATHLSYRLGQLIPAALEAGYVVILVGDNGTLFNGKGTFTEDGLNTPFVVWAPGIEARQSYRLVSVKDLWATVRALRGAPLAGGGEDSWSFADDIFPSEFAPLPQRTYLTTVEFPGLGLAPDPGDWTRAIRNSRYKLIVDVDPAGTKEELYDLQVDPSELSNLLLGTLTQPQQLAYARLQANLPQLT